MQTIHPILEFWIICLRLGFCLFGVGVFEFWARDEFWGLYKRLHMFYFYLQVVPMVEEYLFVCKQWLAQDEGDGKIERTLKVTDKKVYNRRLVSCCDFCNSNQPP